MKLEGNGNTLDPALPLPALTLLHWTVHSDKQKVDNWKVLQTCQVLWIPETGISGFLLHTRKYIKSLKRLVWKGPLDIAQLSLGYSQSLCATRSKVFSSFLCIFFPWYLTGISLDATCAHCLSSFCYAPLRRIWLFYKHSVSSCRQNLDALLVFSSLFKPRSFSPLCTPWSYLWPSSGLAPVRQYIPCDRWPQKCWNRKKLSLSLPCCLDFCWRTLAGCWPSAPRGRIAGSSSTCRPPLPPSLLQSCRTEHLPLLIFMRFHCPQFVIIQELAGSALCLMIPVVNRT